MARAPGGRVHPRGRSLWSCLRDWTIASARPRLGDLALDSIGPDSRPPAGRPAQADVPTVSRLRPVLRSWPLCSRRWTTRYKLVGSTPSSAPASRTVMPGRARTSSTSCSLRAPDRALLADRVGAFALDPFAVDGLAADAFAVDGLAADAFAVDGLAADAFAGDGLAADAFTGDGLPADAFAGTAPPSALAARTRGRRRVGRAAVTAGVAAATSTPSRFATSASSRYSATAGSSSFRRWATRCSASRN
jgi:hypothetical protein